MSAFKILYTMFEIVKIKEDVIISSLVGGPAS